MYVCGNRAGYLTFYIRVGRKYFSNHLEATRYDGLRPIVSRSFSMILETTAHPPPNIAPLFLQTKQKAHIHPLLAALS